METDFYGQIITGMVDTIRVIYYQRWNLSRLIRMGILDCGDLSKEIYGTLGAKKQKYTEK